MPREGSAVEMHAGQLTVRVETVRQMVMSQFPQWRSLTVRRVASRGTVNAIFRVGDQFTARFPLVPADVEATRHGLESEADAARSLLGRTRFPTPEPVALGEPGPEYPLPWSVQTWIPGTVATDADPGESFAFAHDMAEFINDMRAIDTGGRTFGGHGRGGDLLAHDEWMETCFRHSDRLLDVPRLRQIWRVMRDLPRGDTKDLMSHGDLIPSNVLVCARGLAGVLDVGGVGPADPALDLVSAWHLLEAGPRKVLREDLGCDDLAWARGWAWAFEQAMGLVWYYTDSNVGMSQTGRRTLARIMDDQPPGV
jgi:aminoglycoside phosphotransferase (APT) family kinase protein